MSANSGYGQFCPVAKAAEVVTTRWTPLVLRELILGSTRFNEIHRGVPTMSRALLSQRLKELEQVGVIARVLPEGRKSAEYHLTKMGQELKPIIVALGVWGQRWVESAVASNDWDAGALMWDVRRRIDVSALPETRTVIHFDYEDAPKELSAWWVVVDNGEVDLCQSDPGFDVDLFVVSDVRTMARVWIGKQSLTGAIDDEAIFVTGDRQLRTSITSWLLLAKVTEAAQQYERLFAEEGLT